MPLGPVKGRVDSDAPSVQKPHPYKPKGVPMLGPEWDDDTIREKCIEGTIKLHQAITRNGYRIHFQPCRPKSDGSLTKHTLVPNITITGCKNMDEVAMAVSKKYNTNLAEMRGHWKNENIVLARREAFYYSHTILKHSTTQIGRFFHKDHSTVVDSLQKLRKAWGEIYANPNTELATFN